DLEDRVDHGDDADGEHERPPEERSTPAKLQPLSHDETTAHGVASRREVIARNRSSSETRSGSTANTETPPSTSRRTRSAVIRSASGPDGAARTSVSTPSLLCASFTPGWAPTSR